MEEKKKNPRVPSVLMLPLFEALNLYEQTHHTRVQFEPSCPHFGLEIKFIYLAWTEGWTGIGVWEGGWRVGGRGGGRCTQGQNHLSVSLFLLM